jgi:hypothetical protein
VGAALAGGGAGRSINMTMTVPSIIRTRPHAAEALKSRRPARPSLRRQNITLPIVSAMPSASLQPPASRIDARVMKTRNTARNATPGHAVERQQPSDADGGQSGELQVIVCRTRDRTQTEKLG